MTARSTNYSKDSVRVDFTVGTETILVHVKLTLHEQRALLREIRVATVEFTRFICR